MKCIYAAVSLVLATNAALGVLINLPFGQATVTRAAVAAGLAGMIPLAMSGAASHTDSRMINTLLAAFLFILATPMLVEQSVTNWNGASHPGIAFASSVGVVLLMALTLGCAHAEAARHARQQHQES